MTLNKIWINTDTLNGYYMSNHPLCGDEYIRKDALLEWAKERRAFYRKRADNIEDDSNPDVDYFYGKEYAFKELIDKIESL